MNSTMVYRPSNKTVAATVKCISVCDSHRPLRSRQSLHNAILSEYKAENCLNAFYRHMTVWLRYYVFEHFHSLHVQRGPN